MAGKHFTTITNRTDNEEEMNMKKVFAVIITITLFVGSFALAETVDLSQYKDAELISLLEAVQQEIANRHIERSADLPQGSYLVGKDIPAGSYDISVVYKGSMWMDIYIYADGGDGEMKQDFSVFADGNYGDGTGSFHVELTDGELLKCTAPITLTISAGVQFK